MTTRPTLIIPVEEQVRELDAKLLLACVAAERGFTAVLGFRTDVHLRVASLPRGIYFAKSFRPISLRFFEIARGLGHDVVACDEEALVPYPDELYFVRRVSPETLAQISTLFAWGPSSAALFRRCPGYAGQPIYEAGNPRADLLRPELRGYHRAAVDRVLDRFGDFLLVNTNFGTVNHYVSRLGWLKRPPDSGPYQPVRHYIAGLAEHRRALFGQFQRLVPLLSRSFPGLNVVVRPHPVEDLDSWRRVAADLRNVHVVQEGSVVPWLLAARALIHNGCTTSVESFILGKPAVAYMPVVDDRYDLELPNLLGHRASDSKELVDRIGALLERCSPPAEEAAAKGLLEQNVSALDGALSCDRIVGGVEEQLRLRGPLAPPEPLRFAREWLHARGRAAVKRARSLFPGNASTSRYQHHRFPPLPAADLEARIGQLGAALGRFGRLRVRVLHPKIFEVTA
jgi:surface carbohydrate biosynthesis protein